MGEGKLLVGEDQKVDFSGWIEEEELKGPEKTSEKEVPQEVKPKENNVQQPETVKPVEKLEKKIEVKREFTGNDISSSLRERGFDSVFKIEDTLYTLLKSMNNGFESKNSKLYSVSLLARKNENENWRKANKEEFPADGKLKLRIEVPEGSKGELHDYMVLHMFGDTNFYCTPGQVEAPKVVKIKADGKYYLEFEIVGTSPLLIVWKEIVKPVTVENSGQNQGNTVAAQSQQKTVIENKGTTTASSQTTTDKNQSTPQNPSVEKVKLDTAEANKEPENNYLVFFLALGISTVALIALGTGIVILRSK